jgi:hypothetical protein
MRPALTQTLGIWGLLASKRVDPVFVSVSARAVRFLGRFPSCLSASESSHPSAASLSSLRLFLRQTGHDSIFGTLEPWAEPCAGVIAMFGVLTVPFVRLCLTSKSPGGQRRNRLVSPATSVQCTAALMIECLLDTKKLYVGGGIPSISLFFFLHQRSLLSSASSFSFYFTSLLQ